MSINNSTITNIATATGIVAALLLALNLNMFLIAYYLFFLSSFLWAVFAYRTSNRQLLIMNIVFSVINAIGIYNFS
jgi:ABC-type Mn2+/Zn2+ transport system permease subunit